MSFFDFLIAHFKFAAAPATNPVGIRNNTGSGSNANILRLSLTHRQVAASSFSRFTLGGLAVVTRAYCDSFFFLGFGLTFPFHKWGPEPKVDTGAKPVFLANPVGCVVSRS